MAGFRKAKAMQAAIKMGFYGPPGSGKTFTALLVAEGLAAHSGKRVAFVDTERGTDFYAQAVSARDVHPEEFDIDALYTKSIVETLQAVRGIDTNVHGVVVLDSVTHLWEACIQAYSGPRTKIGTVPMSAWGRIKKPYKELMAFLLSSPLHVLICGRQGVQYETDEETDELKAVGFKMKAEGETPYEPHILIRMEQLRAKPNERAQVVAYAEKDRTGILSGRSFINPTFDMLCKPLMHLLGPSQAQIETSDATAVSDAEALADEERTRIQNSGKTLRQFQAQIQLAEDEKALKAIGKAITPKVKSGMVPAHVTQLRESYQLRERELSGQQAIDDAVAAQEAADETPETVDAKGEE